MNNPERFWGIAVNHGKGSRAGYTRIVPVQECGLVEIYRELKEGKRLETAA